MATVFLSLGSNLGDRQSNLSRGLELLSNTRQNHATEAISRMYETESWHAPSHPPYINFCVRFETDFKPEELLKLCKKIEQQCGRDLAKKLAPRPLDIDILFYDNLVLTSDILTIPHPRLHLRRFVLQPLSDITPDLIHPVFKKTIAELLCECGDQSEVRLNEVSSDRMRVQP